jgi:hypothetical protein
LKVYPNLSAHLLEGVEAIMERPYGCGEQTISSSYPSLLVLHYFEKDDGGSTKLPPVGRARARYAQLGYERLLATARPAAASHTGATASPTSRSRPTRCASSTTPLRHRC